MAALNKRAIYFVVLGAACTSAASSYGSEAPSTSPALIEEVVVTAQRREQSLREVPMSVQALTGADLEQNGISSFPDLVQFVPGASVVSSTAPGFETIQMRGIASGTTGDATVGYYIDQVPFGVPNLQLAPPSRMFDLERVEVLRGPSGTLWGQSSMGGTVNIVTTRPDSTAFDAKTRIEASNVDGGDTGYAGDLALNIPIVEDRLAVGLSGGYEKIPGWVESPDLPGEKNLNEADIWNARIKALYTPTDNLDITATYWAIDSAMDGANTFSRLNPATGEEWDEPTMGGTGGNIGFIDTRLDMGSLLIDWDLGPVTLVSASSYIEHELDFVFPLFTGGFQFYNDSTFETDAFAQELRLVSNSEGPLNWMVGAYYRDATISSDIDFYLDAGGGLTFPLINTVGDIDTESWAVYGELSMAFFDGRVEGTVGLRYFEDDRHTANGIDRTTGLPRPSVGDTYTSTNPRFAIKYQASDSGMLFLSATKGFRSGTTQTQSQVDLAAIVGVTTTTTIEPDEVWTYELGAKWEFLEGSLIVDGAIYYSDWSDIQLQFSVPGTIALANGGDAEIRGIDLAVTWVTPVDGLTLQVSGNVNDAEFTNVNPNLAANTVTVADGNKLPNVPENNVTVGVNYTRPLGADLEGFVNAYYAYRDSQIDAGSGLVSGKVNNADLRLGVNRGPWQFALFASNLLDDDDPVVRTGTGVQFLMPRQIGFQALWSR